MSDPKHSASFRDPSGFLFDREGVLYRQVNQSYAAEYSHLMESGLYDELVKIGRIVPHKESRALPLESDISHQVIQPELVPFVSYPYEWTFSQLKEAALVTLSIQQRAFKFGMSLKDASAYNIHFMQGKAVLIDTLSFEFYVEGKPWVAYKQFCQHFLAPLSLMAKKDIRLGQMLRNYIDGIPLDLASRLLPAGTRFDPGLIVHIHLHAGAQKRYAEKEIGEFGSGGGVSKDAFMGLIDSLKRTVQKLKWTPAGTEWGNYYDSTNYSKEAFLFKNQCVHDWVEEIGPSQVWDLGANNGVFSRIASEHGVFVVSFDMDPAAVEHNYRQMRSAGERNILPLILDLTNPSPAIGWHNRERESLIDRAPADMTFALALVHHLCISNNLPFAQLAKFFNDVGKWLIIEFVPKTDSQVQKLLRNRLDIFDWYTIEEFEMHFGKYFSVHKKEKIRDSERSLYLMEKR